MRGAGLVVAAALAVPLHAAPRPGLHADLPDEILAALPPSAGKSPAQILDDVTRAATAFVFEADGLRVVTDRRWFQTVSVTGEGAPLLEIRRWPGDTTIAFYDLDAAKPSIPAVTWSGGGPALDGWTSRKGTAPGPRGSHAILWFERTLATGRRLGAVGVPSDAGLGTAAVDDLQEAILAVVRGARVEERSAAAPIRPPRLPVLDAPPRTADERKDGWQSFQAASFTIGLPPGLRAVALEQSVPPPRPMPYASMWLRGRFVDRDGTEVVLGDGTRAGYVATLPGPDEAWRAGVAPPLGAPKADRLDEAPLDGMVLEWTGASRATVSHWSEIGFGGDWLVFRLTTRTGGVEIGLPVLNGWRSLALFWIPVTWRAVGQPPAPPPIDPAASLGVTFDRLGPNEKRGALIEGSLIAADLRLDVPRGFWPVANLGAVDGLPVVFIDRDGQPVGRLERYAAGAPELAPRAEDGWSAVPRPGAQRASAVWSRADGGWILVAKAGHGFLLLPEGPSAARREAFKQMGESAAFVRAARR